jgi:hypothetical protein
VCSAAGARLGDRAFRGALDHGAYALLAQRREALVDVARVEVRERIDRRGADAVVGFVDRLSREQRELRQPIGGALHAQDTERARSERADVDILLRVVEALADLARLRRRPLLAERADDREPDLRIAVLERGGERRLRGRL